MDMTVTIKADAETLRRIRMALESQASLEAQMIRNPVENVLGDEAWNLAHAEAQKRAINAAIDALLRPLPA